MPLHMTKVAFGCSSVEILRQRLSSDAVPQTSTRYLPKRAEEMIGGSLFWIINHALVARSEILRFEQRDDGRWAIFLSPDLKLVHPKAKRAHQGWRYLERDAAPEDLLQGAVAAEAMPVKLVRELSALGLL